MFDSRRWRHLVAGLVTAVLAASTPVAQAAFSITTRWDGGNSAKPQYEIDTNSGLVFKISAYNNGGSTQSQGDISSLVYNGVQYQNASRG